MAKLTFKLNFSLIKSLVKPIKPIKSLIKSLNLINFFLILIKLDFNLHFFLLSLSLAHRVKISQSDYFGLL